MNLIKLNNVDFIDTNSESFKYNTALVGKTAHQTGIARSNNLKSYLKTPK